MGWFRKKVKKSADVKEWSDSQILDLGKFLGIDISQYDEGRLSEVTYFACLKILSEAVAKLPLTLQKATKNGGVEDAAESPLYNTVRIRPNPFMTPSSFWEAMENNRNHFGNAYALIRYTNDTVELYPLSSENMTVKIPQDKRLSQVTDLIYEYVYPETGETVVFPSENLLHFKSSTTFGGLLGVSVRDKLRMSLDGAKDSQAVLNEMYKSNMTGKAVVQYAGSQEINSELSRKFIQDMHDYAQGTKGTGKAFIPIPYGTTVTPLSLRLADEQFLELRKYTALQIASAFGIKPNQLNDYERASYANSEAQQLAFYAETMLSILKQYEEELNYKLLTARQIAEGYRFKFNVAAVLRGDTKAQVESLCQGIANGLYTPNEARRNLDLPSMEGGDRIYFNGSNIAVEDAGAQYCTNGIESAADPQPSDCQEHTKALLRLAETIEKAVEYGIMGLDKGWVTINGRHVFIGDDGGGGGSGDNSLSENSKKPITEITDKTIDKVPYVAISGYSEEQCKKIQELHKELLRFSRDENGNKETAFVFREDLSDRAEIKGTDDRLDLGGSLHGKGKDLIIMHNHPRNSSYSMNDLALFLDNDNIKTMTVVKNNGSVEILSKTDEFNKSSAITSYKRQFKKYVSSGSDEEINKAINGFLTSGKGGLQWLKN